MTVFPIFLSLSDRSCLVVGGGAVGRAKAQRLVEAEANVLLVDPVPSTPLMQLLSSNPRLTLEARRFEDRDCEGRSLVFACTDDLAVNESVRSAASIRGVLCCRGDGGDTDFSTAATLRRGDLCVAVSSGGASPSLAARARDEIAAVIGDEYALAARLLASLREQLRGEAAGSFAATDAQHEVVPGVVREVLRGVLDDGLLDLLRQGRHADAQGLVDRARAGAEFPTADPRGDRCTR